MMNRLHFALAICSMVAFREVNAQCDYDHQGMDSFLQTYVVETSTRVAMFSAANDHLRFRSEGAACTIRFTGSVPNEAVGVAKGALLYLLLTDGTVIRCEAVRDAATRPVRHGYIIVDELDCTYTIDKAALVQMRDTAIKGIRFEFIGSGRDIDMDKPVKQEKVMWAVRCLLAGIPD